jgi:myosin-5
MIKSYAGRKKGDLEPHLFAIAEEALDCMRRGTGGGGKDQTGAGDQTIVVSGERYDIFPVMLSAGSCS